MKYRLFFLLAIVALFSGCSTKYVESSSSVQAVTDETAIVNYAKSHNLTTALLKDAGTGIYYRKLVTNATGTAPANQYNLHVAFKISHLNDSVWVSKSVADSVIFNIYTMQSTVFSGFITAISMLKEGEKGQFILPSAVAYGANPPTSPTGIVKNEVIILEMELVHLISEDEQISKYMSKKGLVATQTATDGLRFIRQNAAVVGDSLKTGDVISVKYNGMLLSEASFDSGTFNYTIGANNVIVGFSEGLGKMKKGEKARLVFPSTIGYGATGSSPKIPPYSPLIFDVEIVTVNGL